MRIPLLALAAAAAAAIAVIPAVVALAAEPPGSLRLPVRTRVELFRGSGDWRAVPLDHRFTPRTTALILCDLWDKHWCRGSNERVNVLAPKVAAVVDQLRSRGVLIIHAPSDTMGFYKEAPARLAMLQIPKQPVPLSAVLDAPQLPIDDASGGCETHDASYAAWSRQHAAINIAPGDLISDKGDEVYSALKFRGVDTLLVAGVHTNMCILNRTFAIKQMTRWGVRCILLRDLTDSMYDPADAPHVSHERGTELVIEHIEKYWAPTTTSAEVLSALGARH